MEVSRLDNSQRPRISHGTIVRALRFDIVNGQYAPGVQLPTRSVLEKRFQASSTTVQRALDRLVHEGFACVKARQGTFVAENPPHLSRCGLVFPKRMADFYKWSRWWVTLQQQAAVLQSTSGCTISTYYSDDGREDSEDYQQLLGDVLSHRLAGLIFVTPPFELRDTPILEQPGLARAAIMAEALLPDVMCVFPDMTSFFDRAVAHVASRGRKRIAIIGTNPVADLHRDFDDAIARQGLTTRPYWIHSVHPERADAAANVAHLLMRGQGDERPDALVVSDDNLVDAVMSGITDAGVSVPRDLEIVAHCNFPWPAPRTLSLTRLGFDARKIMEICLDLVETQRDGGRPPAMTRIPAVFEHEGDHSI